MRINHIFISVFLFSFLALNLRGQSLDYAKVGLFPDDSQLELSADTLSYSQDANLAKAKGSVRADYGTLHLSADEVTINQETLDFTASGNILFSSDKLGTWECDDVRGNINEQSFGFGIFRLDGEIWHAGGQNASGYANGDKELQDAWLSTCDCKNPHYCLHAKKIVHHANQTFTAKHVFLEFGGVPVFYLPYLWGSTNENSAGWIVRPGYSGKKGAYIRLGRIWKHPGEHESMTMAYADAMSKRGFGLGLEGQYQVAVREFGDAQAAFQAYGLHDRRAPGRSDGYDRRFESIEDRYRLQLYARQDVTDSFTIRLNADVLSDISMLEDWYKHDYRNNYQPKSFLSLAYDSRRLSLELNVRPRLNRFYTAVETLPELSLTIPAFNPAGLPFTYTSRNTAGYYSLKWRDFAKPRLFFYPDQIRNQLYSLSDAERTPYLHDASDYSAGRFDSLHTIAIPLDILEGVKLTPRASFRLTAYSDSSSTRMTGDDLAGLFQVDNPDTTKSLARVKSYDRKGGSLLRLAEEYGLELRTRFYSDWMAWQPWDILEIDGITHIIEPYLNYTYAPSPTEDRDFIYFFDETDRLERQNFLRAGLNQFWQTRTEGKIRTLIRWQTYSDLHFIRGEESNRYPGDFGNRLTVYPRRDFSVWGTVLHDLGEGNLQRGEIGFRIGQEESLNLAARYIYRNDHFSRSAASMGSELVDFTGESGYLKKYFEYSDSASAILHIPINDKTWADCEWEYDFDHDRMSEHKYTITRVLHCWTMQLGAGWDNNEFEAMILFRLTAFPNIKIDMGF